MFKYICPLCIYFSRVFKTRRTMRRDKIQILGDAKNLFAVYTSMFTLQLNEKYELDCILSTGCLFCVLGISHVYCKYLLNRLSINNHQDFLNNFSIHLSLDFT